MAISAHEFRIGNYLLLDNPKHRLNDTEEIYKVCGITENTLRLIRENNNPYEDSYGQFLEYLKPIPITEEWLLNFGLTNVTEELDAEKSFEIKFGRKAFRVVIDDRGLCTVIYQVDIGMNFQELTDVEFVHEFQNVIFALCGEELKLN